MTEQKRILVVVDPTASVHPAIERATWLAHHLPARVELFVSDYTAHLTNSRSPAAAGADARTAVLERHRRRLEQLAEPLRRSGMTVDCDARWDYPLHDSIVRKSVDYGADIVIKDTHYHSALQRSIFSNTDWSLIRACAAALWLVKPRPPGQRPCFVAAVDPLHERDKPADLDQRILSTANVLSTALGGEVHVFHAFDVSARHCPLDGLHDDAGLATDQRFRRCHACRAHRGCGRPLQSARRPAGTHACPARQHAGNC